MLAIVDLAQDWCARHTERIASPTKYIAGFRMPNRRQLAFERNRQTIFCWTESISLEGAPATPVRAYAADKSRNSNLNNKNCPQLTTGHAALYWQFDTLGELQDFVRWYGNIPAGAV